MDAVAGFFDFAIGRGIALHGNFHEGVGADSVFGSIGNAHHWDWVGVGIVGVVDHGCIEGINVGCCGRRFGFDFLLGNFKGFDIDLCTLVGDAAVPEIALGDGFSHIIGGGVFVFAADFGALYFLGFWNEDDVEGVFGLRCDQGGDFYAVEIGVGKNEFIGTGAEVEVEIPIEAGLSELGPIAVKNLYHGQRCTRGIYHNANDLGFGGLNRCEAEP